LCSQFSTVGKLVIIAMMIRGRHRGLPYGLDRAILLPSETLNAKEAADAEARIARQASHASVATAGVTGSTARRRRSLSGERAGMLITSLLHPGPAKNHLDLGVHHRLHRRNTDPDIEDPEPYAPPRRTMSAMPDSAGQAANIPRPRPRSAATTAM
jgi:hypothetical protein